MTAQQTRDTLYQHWLHVSSLLGSPVLPCMDKQRQLLSFQVISYCYLSLYGLDEPGSGLAGISMNRHDVVLMLCQCSRRKIKMTFLAHLIVKNGGLLQLKCSVVGVGVGVGDNICLWAR